jgi:hypothetical protein
MGQPRFTRHTVLRAGLAGGLTLAGLLRAESLTGDDTARGSSLTGQSVRCKSVINIHLDGGPPHQDMIDLKPSAPVEIRGEFTPIATRLAGFQVCEHLPGLAAIAHRLVFIRSLVGAVGAHDAFQCQSGWEAKSLAAIGGRPAMGAVVAKLQGSPSDEAPAFVDMMQGRPLVRNSARPGFLGPSYQPFRPAMDQWFSRPLEEGMKRELAARGADHQVQLRLDERLTRTRLDERSRLASQLDRFRRDADNSRMMDAMDAFSRQAVGILTSGRFAEALDLEREPASGVARYVPVASAFGRRFTTAEGPESVKKFLMARRLIEAGVRCVSLSLSDFDTHSDNFGRMRNLLPLLDHGLSALVSDLDERGMLEDVSIVVWGEFGRTPKIDGKTGGRHHWPAVGMCLMAGGGVRAGQVIGETDRDAATAIARPVHYQEVFATLYRNLGIKPQGLTLNDISGRPQHVLERSQPIREIV